MSTTFSLNRLFACAAAMTLAAGPALAQSSEMDRVEIRGRVVDAPVHYNVHETCDDIDGQLQSMLQKTWEREGRYGEVKVQFVMEHGDVNAVQANGISHIVARDVKNAVHRLHCGPQATASAQIYRFDVAFVDPNAPRDLITAKARRNGVQISMLSR